MYLDHALKTQPSLRRAIESGQLFAFADDLLVICKDRAEMETIVEGLSCLEHDYGLALNKGKSAFLSDALAFKDVNEVGGILRRTEYKYLGITVNAEKKVLLRNCKSKVMQSLNAFRTRVKVNNRELQNMMFSSFVKSQLIYNFSSLYCAGLVSLGEVESMELYYRRLIYGLPMDVKNQVIKNVTDYGQRPISDILEGIKKKV